MNANWSAVSNIGACAYKGHMVSVRGLAWVALHTAKALLAFAHWHLLIPINTN
jgi:hypothetical protein